MSLDKGIAYGKEHRRQYCGPKSYDVNCRNHGSCEHCRNNRLYSYRKSIARYNSLLQNTLSEALNVKK